MAVSLLARAVFARAGLGVPLAAETDSFLARRSRPRIAPLRVLAALLVLVAGVTTGTSVAEAQNGVTAITPESPAAVGAEADITAGHVGSETRVFDDFTLGVVLPPQTTSPRQTLFPYTDRGGTGRDR